MANGDLAKKAGSSAFFILFILIAIASLTYLGIWSYNPQNNSIRGLSIFIIFISLIFSALVLYREQVLFVSSWREDCNNFTVGFLFWAAIGSFFGTNSVLSLAENTLFSSIAGELPQLLEFLSTSFIIPIAEELFWMVTIPYSTVGLLNLFSNESLFGQSFKFLKNKYVQIVAIIIVSGSTFAYFHVGKQVLLFIIAAFIFRTIQIALTFGDASFDIITFAKVTIAFNIGAHIGNNFVNYGIAKGWAVLIANLFPAGILVIALFVLIFLTALDSLLIKIRNASA